VTRSRLDRLICLHGPLGLLLLGFVAICIRSRTAWPWDRVVHEDGERTLIETVLYFSHAVRELPADIVLGIGVAGSVLFFYPPDRVTETSDRWGRVLRAAFAWSVIATVTAILAGAAITNGAQSVLGDLAQLRTRPGAPEVWGAHWRYHLLSRLALILLSFSAVGGYCMLTKGSDRRLASPRMGGFAAALVLFASCSLLFGLSTEPFADPVFLGHQARELFSHSFVTVPLAVGATMWAARRASPGSARTVGKFDRRLVYATGFLAVLIGAYLAAGLVWTGARSRAQSDDLVVLIFSHFFEHSLGYVLVPLVAGLTYLLATVGNRED
jgi:hypothetical protein